MRTAEGSSDLTSASLTRSGSGGSPSGTTPFCAWTMSNLEESIVLAGQ